MDKTHKTFYISEISDQSNFKINHHSRLLMSIQLCKLCCFDTHNTDHRPQYSK